MIKLYNSSGTQIAVSQNGATSYETITKNTSVAATYYLQVTHTALPQISAIQFMFKVNLVVAQQAALLQGLLCLRSLQRLFLRP